LQAEHYISAADKGLACRRAFDAGVAQVVEQLICNQLVGGSIPFSGFFYWPNNDFAQIAHLYHFSVAVF
jgi:hypothetical protein